MIDEAILSLALLQGSIEDGEEALEEGVPLRLGLYSEFSFRSEVYLFNLTHRPILKSSFAQSTFNPFVPPAVWPFIFDLYVTQSILKSICLSDIHKYQLSSILMGILRPSRHYLN